MKIEYTEARVKLPKNGLSVYKRICKSRNKCTHYCEHRNPHMVSIACHIRSCDTQGKDVRCVPVQP